MLESEDGADGMIYNPIPIGKKNFPSYINKGLLCVEQYYSL